MQTALHILVANIAYYNKIKAYFPKEISFMIKNSISLNIFLAALLF